MMDISHSRRTAEMQRCHYELFQNLMPDLMSRLFWNREEIDRFRTQELRSLLRHAKLHSPWHAKRLVHIDADRATVADLRSVPPMTKADLMENWDSIVTVPGASLLEAEQSIKAGIDRQYLWGDRTVIASGGTGGAPGLFVYDWDALAIDWSATTRSISIALLRDEGQPSSLIRRLLDSALTRNWVGRSRSWAIRAMMRAGRDRPMRSAAIGAESSSHGSYVLATIFSDPAAPTLRLSAWRPLAEIVSALNEFQPEVLSIYPSLIGELESAIAAGALKIDPVIILFVSEHLSADGLARARALWPRSLPLTFWSTSEASATFPCPLADGGFHVSEDLAVIEPVSSENSHGFDCGIYLTNLYNRALPIIRYHVDDMFEFADGHCACGLAYAKISTVHGRAFERFFYDGKAVHPLAIELPLLKETSVRSYQLRQSVNGVEVRYTGGERIDQAKLKAEIARSLEEHGVAAPDVVVERVDEIERTVAGKLRRYVPMSGQNKSPDS